MQRTPGVTDWLFIMGFLVVSMGFLLGGGWLMSGRATGVFRSLYFVAVAPLVILVWSLSWEWLFDVTAGNLWPLALVVWGVPCWMAWLFIAWLERRHREQDWPFSR